jgi:ferredoxin
MAMKILATCIDCGACIEECPNEAIVTGEGIHVVVPERCTECVGAFETPQCQDRCPIEDCIVPDPEHQESREELEQRYARIHAT